MGVILRVGTLLFLTCGAEPGQEVAYDLPFVVGDFEQQVRLGHPPGAAGRRVDGRVFPIDERPEFRWGRDPYLLACDGNGTRLDDGVQYLLAYYMGRAHGFISASEP